MELLVLLLVIVAVVVSYKWFTKKYGKGSKYDQIAVLDGPGKFEFDIVGESNYQRALKRIAGPKDETSKRPRCTAILILEDDNPHDDKAVRVDIEGQTVGYLDRKMARQYRNQLARQGISARRFQVEAMIVGGWDRGRSDRGHYGVLLDLPMKD